MQDCYIMKEGEVELCNTLLYILFGAADVEWQCVLLATFY